MRTPIFQVDAFTTRRFAGNPAAVMPMESFPEDALLQAIAAENNLAETAFLVPDAGDYRLRWFTPTTEVYALHPRRDRELFVSVLREAIAWASRKAAA